MLTLEFFDTKLYHYTESLIKKRCPVASTKICHDVMLGFEEIIFLVGECESNSFHEELIRIILCLVQMLVYLDVAYGFIVTGHIIYVVRAKLCNDQYKYHVLPWQYHPERLSCENGKLHQRSDGNHQMGGIYCDASTAKSCRNQEKIQEPQSET